MSQYQTIDFYFLNLNYFTKLFQLLSCLAWYLFLNFSANYRPHWNYLCFTFSCKETNKQWRLLEPSLSRSCSVNTKFIINILWFNSYYLLFPEYRCNNSFLLMDTFDKLFLILKLPFQFGKDLDLSQSYLLLFANLKLLLYRLISVLLNQKYSQWMDQWIDLYFIFL